VVDVPVPVDVPEVPEVPEVVEVPDVLEVVETLDVPEPGLLLVELVPVAGVVLITAVLVLLPVVVVPVALVVAEPVPVLVLSALFVSLVAEPPAPPPPPPQAANARLPAPASNPLKNRRRDAGALKRAEGSDSAHESRRVAPLGAPVRTSRDMVSHP
jgi:hypothetical protein